MLGMEEILCELGVGTHNEDDHMSLNQHGNLPPGFRFHPTDEELITFYLASKVLNGRFSCGVNNIAEVDLNRCEPWELPEAAKMGEREWYFFSLRDRKYPTGLRTNRATCAGYWKATGKDREVYSGGGGGGGSGQGVLVGMKKTLVFYKGRAPRGEKTKWVMHEYRLDVDFFHRHSCKEEWVICRILHKTGEKRPNLLLQGQNHHHHLNLIAGYSPPSGGGGGGGGFGLLLPPLLESPPAAPVAAAAAAAPHVESQSHQNNNNNNHNQGGEEESYDDLQIKSLINPVFSQYLFNNIIPPLINTGSTSSSPSSTLPPFPTTNTNTNTNTTANLWEDFMGFPFVTADGFQCF